MEETTQKQPPKVVDEYSVPGYQYQLTHQEFEVLTRPLEMFEWAISMKNHLLNKARAEGKLVPVTQDDIELNEQKQWVYKKEFIDKYK